MAEQAPKIDSEVSATRELVGSIEAERLSRDTSMHYGERIQAGDTSVFSSGDVYGGSNTQQGSAGTLQTRKGELGVTLANPRPDGGSNQYIHESHFELRSFKDPDGTPDTESRVGSHQADMSKKYDNSKGGDVSVTKVDNEGNQVYESRLTGKRAERARLILTQRATRNVLQKLAEQSQ